MGWGSAPLAPPPPPPRNYGPGRSHTDAAFVTRALPRLAISLTTCEYTLNNQLHKERVIILSELCRKIVCSKPIAQLLQVIHLVMGVSHKISVCYKHFIRHNGDKKHMYYAISPCSYIDRTTLRIRGHNIKHQLFFYCC